MPKKWRMILVAMFLTSLTLVACGGGNDVNTADDGGDMGTEATQVEVFSWWTGGGEAAGLEAMIGIFDAEYPNIEFMNAAVAGGAGPMPVPCLLPACKLAIPPIAGRVTLGKN